MNIYHISNSSFLIKTENGKRILINPKTINSDLQDFNLIILNNFNNSNIDTKLEGCKVINSTDYFTNEFCDIAGFNTYQDELLGLKRGENIIFKILIDDVTICHLGNLGHYPSNEIIEKIKGVNILFAPIGENYTIKLTLLKKLISVINPSFIIPTNYKTHNSNQTLNSLDKFLNLFKKYTIKNLESLFIKDTTDLSNTSNIIILSENQKFFETKKE